MDYERVKNEISEIANIAASVPEEFREKTFEILLTSLLGESSHPVDRRDEGKVEKILEDPQNNDGAPKAHERSGGDLPMNAALRVFLRKTDLTVDEVQTVVMFESGTVHFVREPQDRPVATGQIEWSLLLALKNAIENEKFEVDAESVRSVCQDRGYYNAGNFASTFRKAKNAALFKETPEPQGEAQPLSQQGQDELGRLVKRLASES